jgi:hypothetical protein
LAGAGLCFGTGELALGQSAFFGYYWWVNNIVEGGVEGGSQRQRVS